MFLGWVLAFWGSKLKSKMLLNREHRPKENGFADCCRLWSAELLQAERQHVVMGHRAVLWVCWGSSSWERSSHVAECSQTNSWLGWRAVLRMGDEPWVYWHHVQCLFVHIRETDHELYIMAIDKLYEDNNLPSAMRAVLLFSSDYSLPPWPRMNLKGMKRLFFGHHSSSIFSRLLTSSTFCPINTR